MTEPTIDELLGALPDAVDPDPDFAATLRARVRVELQTPAERVQPHVVTGTDTEETAMTLTEEPPTEVAVERRPRTPWLAAAAVLVAIVVAGALLFAGDDDGEVDVVDDGEPSPTVQDDEQGLVDPPEEPAAPIADRAPITYAGATIEEFDAEGQPFRVAATTDALWTMRLEGLLEKRDPTTTAVVGSVQVGDSSLIDAGDDSIWVADARSGQVVRVDSASATVVATVDIGAQRYTGFRQGRTAQVSGSESEFTDIGDVAVTGDAVWVSDFEGRLLRIDPATNAVAAEYDVGVPGHLIEADDRYVVLADQIDQHVAVVDVATGEIVDEIEDLDFLIGATVQRGIVHVWDKTGVVVRLDVADGSRTMSEELGRVSTGLPDASVFPHPPAVSDAGLLVTTRDELVALDPDTLEVIARHAMNGTAGQLTVGPDDTAWVTQYYGSSIFRLPAVAE